MNGHLAFYKFNNRPTEKRHYGLYGSKMLHNLKWPLNNMNLQNHGCKKN